MKSLVFVKKNLLLIITITCAIGSAVTAERAAKTNAVEKIHKFYKGKKRKHSEQLADAEQRNCYIHKNLRRFLKKHAPPPAICKIIEEKKDLIEGLSKTRIDQLPGFFIKNEEISRIINATRMQSFISKDHLHCLYVPNKYVYKVNNVVKVFVEYIEPGDSSQPLSLQEVQQLAMFVEKTGYGDFGFNHSNVIRDKYNRLVFIDTEDNSFFDNGFSDLYYWLVNLRFQEMTVEAATWVEDHNNAYHQSDQALDYQVLSQNSEFDDYEIDYEIVKKFQHWL